MTARIGIVGAGWWTARTHVPALLRHADAQLVGICDAEPERARTVAEAFGIPHAVTDIAELLGLGLDGLLVATSNDAHHAPAAAALDAGVHVLVEKPLAVDPQQAWDLVHRARRAGVTLQTGYTFIHSPHAAALRAAVTAGELGDVVLATGLFCTAMSRLLAGKTAKSDVVVSPLPSTYTGPGGGQAQAQLTHGASLLLFLSGLEPGTVGGFAADRDYPVDIVDTMTARCRDGALMTLATTGTVHDHEARTEEYRVFGTAGQAALDTRRGTLTIERAGREPQRFPGLAVPAANPQDAPAASLVRAALGRGPAVESAELGARTATLLAAAARSARCGTLVEVAP